MAIYALSQRDNETYDAAGKAIRDVYCVLKEYKPKMIWSIPKSKHKIVKILDFPYLIIYTFFNIGKGDFIFFSVPENVLKIKVVKLMKHIKKYKVICFINDLNAFRYGNLESTEAQEKINVELDMIKCADYAIVPNKNTIQLFENYHIEARMVATGVWDFIMDSEPNANEKFMDGKIHIAFAGNLNKSEFIKYLKPSGNIVYDLWGKLDENKKAQLPQGCIYHGVLKADEVPNAICNCSFGLVWDGTGENCIEGGLGEYLRYNNSHKCGVYLAAGILPIVWSESGMAHFVNENKCGLVIDRLDEIEQKVYEANTTILQKNAKKVAKKIRRGFYLENAFEQIFNDNVRAK